MQKIAEKIRQNKKGVLFIGFYLLFKWTLILGAGSWLMKNGYWKNQYLLVLPLLAISIHFIRKRRKSVR